jgi:RNA polymerase sigma factor (sigma-70 family)
LTIRIARQPVENDVSPLLHRRLSDEALGSRLASGEAAAFDELYRRYVHRLSAYGAHLLGDAASGDDVAQSTLLKAYGALRDGRLPDRMRPWLYRIAHNTALDLVARRRELPSAELPERVSSEPPPRAGALLEALAALPDRQRDVYVLRELHGLRIDETCAQLGLTTVQVEQALFAARNRLAEHLTFGERLNCVAVQRLASGPLDAEERRALKTHLRSCRACRSTLGLRGRALSLLPVTSADWLRGLASTLIGGGAPAAAKVGAVVATATVAAALPSAATDLPPHPRVVAAAVASVAASHRDVVPAKPVTVSAPQRVPAAAVARPVPSAPHGVRHAEREHAPAREDGAARPAAPRVRELRSGSGDGRSAESSDGGPATTTQPTTTTSEPIASTTPVDGGDGGSASSGSSDGGSGGGGGDASSITDGHGGGND